MTMFNFNGQRVIRKTFRTKNPADHLNEKCDEVANVEREHNHNEMCLIILNFNTVVKK